MLFLVLVYAACAIVVLLDIGALVLVVIGLCRIVRKLRYLVATDDYQQAKDKTEIPEE